MTNFVFCLLLSPLSPSVVCLFCNSVGFGLCVFGFVFFFLFVWIFFKHVDLD